MSTVTPGFESDIKPLFNERDRGSMLPHFDLWSYDEVGQNADAILQTVSTGSMPLRTVAERAGRSPPALGRRRETGINMCQR